MEELRRCGRCRKLKRVSEFAWRRKARGQRHNMCRPCHAEYHREHYLANKQRYIDQAAKVKRKLMRERTLLLLDYFKLHPCTDCGETDPIVLEFDHLRDKRFAIGGHLIRRPWKDVVAEMKKCEVVCANCHRRRTAQRRGTTRALLTKQDPAE
jgi:hypothetical protein